MTHIRALALGLCGLALSCTVASAWPPSPWTPEQLDAMKAESARNMGTDAAGDAAKKARLDAWWAERDVRAAEQRKIQAQIPEKPSLWESMGTASPRTSVTCTTFSTYGRRYSSSRTTCY